MHHHVGPMIRKLRKWLHYVELVKKKPPPTQDFVSLQRTKRRDLLSGLAPSFARYGTTIDLRALPTAPFTRDSFTSGAVQRLNILVLSFIVKIS